MLARVAVMSARSVGPAGRRAALNSASVLPARKGALTRSIDHWRGVMTSEACRCHGEWSWTIMVPGVPVQAEQEQIVRRKRGHVDRRSDQGWKRRLDKDRKGAPPAG
jgi:hypothetical protein